jgi:hypothetical protein
MYKAEQAECKAQLKRYQFDKKPLQDRPALWDTIKKRIVDDRVHIHLKGVLDIVQYSNSNVLFDILGL